MDFNLHGANPENHIKGKVYDFSTNTNVIRQRFKVRKELAYSYPSISGDFVKEKLKYDNKNVLITNGINEAIYILASMFSNVAIIQPTYVEYERALCASGSKITHRTDFDDLDYDAIFLCNPNNPTGTYYPFAEIQDLIYRCAKANTVLIIDESYIDFTMEPYDIPISKHVILLRSLTKTYHLSGLRLGYVIAHESVIKLMDSIKPTWSVNSIALDVGRQVLSSKTHVKRTRKYYSKETARLVKELKSMGYEVLDSSTHYFLMKVENDEEFMDYLLSKRILVRHTRNFRGLDGRYVRICTRTRKENNFLIKVLKKKENL